MPNGYEKPINRLINEQQHIISLAKHTLFVSEEEFQSITTAPFVQVGNRYMSVTLLKAIISSPRYYSYVLRFFKGNTTSFSISFLKNNEVKKTVAFNKATIIRALAEAIQSGKIVPNKAEEEKINVLKNETTLAALTNYHNKAKTSFSIDGQNYDIFNSQLIALLQMPESEFLNICTNPKIKYINSIPKEHFFYAAISFCNDQEIFANYDLPQPMYQRYEDIKSSKYLDIEAINRHGKTTDLLHTGVKLDPSLVSHGLDSMPDDISDIEKACYVYIKLCRTLVYDEEYFATCQKGLSTIKHKDINYLSTITPENNQVVCFEFNLIFAKFLSMLGFNLKSNYTDSNTENYGDVHANLEFRCGKFIIRADSVTSILQGDLFRAKVGSRLIGLKCMNKNEETIEEFKQALSDMYNLVSNQELLTKYANNETPFVNYTEAIREYQKLAKAIPQISIQEKLNILFNKVTSSGLAGVDTYSYILSLMLVIFDTKERYNNISFTVLSDYIPQDPNKEAMPIGIFAVNNQGLDESEEPNRYYIYSPYYQTLTAISKMDLQHRFDTGQYVYMPDFEGIVVGIQGGRK